MKWSMAKIGEVSEILSGNAWKSSGFTSDVGDRLPVIRIQNVSNQETDFVYWDGDVIDKYKIANGDLLLSLSGNVKLCQWRFGTALLNQRVVRLTPLNMMDKRYFYWALDRVVVQLEALAKHAVIANVSVADLKAFEIPLPPLAEQQRIAAILDKADAIRRKRQQAIQLADEFLRAVFLDMFGDPVTNPKGWEVRKVSDISRQVTVGLVIKPASYYVDKGIPAIRSLNIKETGIDQNNFVYFSESDNAGPLAKSRVYSGDIVIVRSGQPGKAAVIPDDLDGVNAIDVLILRPDAQCINSEYFAYFMNSGAGKNLVMSEGRGQIQQHLNVGSLSAADVPVPALELQEKFVRTLNDVRDKFSVEGDGKHFGLFNSLSQKAFKGEL